MNNTKNDRIVKDTFINNKIASLLQPIIDVSFGAVLTSTNSEPSFVIAQADCSLFPRHNNKIIKVIKILMKNGALVRFKDILL